MNEKTKEDLVQFIKDSEFDFSEWWDYVTNIGIMSDAVQFMNRDWYIEEMQPACVDGCAYAVADYYDRDVKDVIVFDTEIWRRNQMSPEEVAEYLWRMNERYKDVRTKYKSMYWIFDNIKKLFNLFKVD